MSKKIKAQVSEGYQIRHKGVFNLEKLYQTMHAWLDENGYDFLEADHQHKKIDIGDEIGLIWKAEREITDFMKYDMVIKFRFKELHPASDNLVSGTSKITFTASVVLDYREQWSSSRIKNLLFRLYTNVLIKENITKNKLKLLEEVKDLQKTAKEVLEFFR
ncbi:hypothetical protein HOG16_02275 [Candidatus Woesearchaeota archaeon]|jgi:hypothetical protein|nr:hypothetical protein [Candidatus Woesearchaeota archaeon]MBT4321818.1 hypothetical protein [Candidatus Woesearchaeota archaeon]